MRRLLPTFAAGIAAGAACLLAVACSGTSSSVSSATAGWEAGRPARVRLTDFRSGAAFELINEARTSRVEFYSTARNDAITKVATDEVMDSLLEFLNKECFRTYGISGPATGSEGASWAIEVEVGGEGDSNVSHVSVRPGTPQAELDAYNYCRQNFLALYNGIFQAQAVENREGSSFFEKPSQGVRRD